MKLSFDKTTLLRCACSVVVVVVGAIGSQLKAKQDEETMNEAIRAEVARQLNETET